MYIHIYVYMYVYKSFEYVYNATYIYNMYKTSVLRLGLPRRGHVVTGRGTPGMPQGPQTEMEFSSGSHSSAAANREIPNAGYPPGTSAIILQLFVLHQKDEHHITSVCVVLGVVSLPLSELALSSLQSPHTYPGVAKFRRRRTSNSSCCCCCNMIDVRLLQGRVCRPRTVENATEEDLCIQNIPSQSTYPPVLPCST